MNLILLEPNAIDSSGRARIGGAALRHVVSVHRASVGDELRVGVVNGEIGTGRLLALSDTEAELEIALTQRPPPKLDLRLFLALPRPKYLSRILTAVTSLGIAEIYLINSYRVEKAYWSCDQLRAEEIRAACWKGLEQARDTVLPNVELRRLFKPFIEDEVPHLVVNREAFVAHPVGSRACPSEMKTPLALAIGPEGGFIPYEIEKLVAAGFEVVTFGSRILNVETAIPALIGKLAQLP